MFYDERINRWEIATKDNIGGYEKYPNDLLYRTIESVFNDLLGGMPNEDINFLPFLEYKISLGKKWIPTMPMNIIANKNRVI